MGPEQINFNQQSSCASTNPESTKALGTTCGTFTFRGIKVISASPCNANQGFSLSSIEGEGGNFAADRSTIVIRHFQ
jgi:hypothetical protein